VFNSVNNDNNSEVGFADAYKSEILHRDDDIDDNSSKNLIIILSLIAIILGLSIFGYIYMSKMSLEKGAKEVSKEEEIVEPPKSSGMLNNIDDLLMEAGNADKMDEIVSEEEDKNDSKEGKKKVTTTTNNKDVYLEQLADLSKEIDEDNKSKKDK
jgi:hypothetical protein